jgi:cytochrome c oxidase cbb3-type subunit 3
MRVHTGFTAAVLLALSIAAADRTTAQGPPGAAAAPPQGGRGGRAGGFVPGQSRPPEDAAAVARGKALYGIHCTACHGADLRGGDVGGPNLLRSQLALADKAGENIVPVIQGSRASTGMPPISVSPEDAKALASYVRSVLETIGRQGMPPAIGMPAGSILVGDAAAGKVFFDSKCASCHSVAGDLQGIGGRITDPKAMQNSWVSGGGGRGGRGGGAPAAPGAITRRTVMVTVNLPGEKVEGRLVRIDDFYVTVGLPDGMLRTIRRIGDNPKVEVKDPMKGHRDLLPTYTDKDMHNVTAYLVTVK